MAQNLDSPERIAKYLNEAFETADSFFIASAIGDAARAQGMTAIAKKARVERSALYRSVARRDPHQHPFHRALASKSP